jgi:uncharacterized membrane protein YoaK (UPF0700 family)
MTTAATSSTGSWTALKLMTVVLSLVAGSMDVISFLGLGGLFTAHITGNLVILAAHVATGEAAQVAPMLSVPVFMAALFLARLAAGMLEKVGIESLKPLLLVQFLLLAGCLAICLALGSGFDPNGATATVAGMIAVCALGVQNALVQVSLHGVPTTAVVTTNVARFTTDLGTILLGAGRAEEDAARRGADKIWPSIVGFVVGCGVGALCESRYGLNAVAFPTGLALVAIALAWARPFRGQSGGRGDQAHALSAPSGPV